MFWPKVLRYSQYKKAVIKDRRSINAVHSEGSDVFLTSEKRKRSDKINEQSMDGLMSKGMQDEDDDDQTIDDEEIFYDNNYGMPLMQSTSN